MNDLLIYSLPASGLSNAIAVANGVRVSYNWKDVKALEIGDMSEEIYISKNMIA